MFSTIFLDGLNEVTQKRMKKMDRRTFEVAWSLPNDLPGVVSDQLRLERMAGLTYQLFDSNLLKELLKTVSAFSRADGR